MTGVVIRRLCACCVLALLVPSFGVAQERLRPMSIGTLPPISLSADATMAWPAPLVTACDYYAQTKSDVSSGLPADLQAGLHPDPQVGAFGATFKIPFGAPPDNANGSNPLSVWTIGACAQLYGWLASRTGDAAPSRADAVRIHFALDRLGKHLKKIADQDTKPGTTSVVLARARLDQAKSAIEHRMRGIGMLNRFSAAAFVGAPISSIGRTVMGPTGTPPAALVEGSTETFSSSLVVETAHWGWPGENARDASLRFRIAHEPATVLMSSTSIDPSKSTLIVTSLPGLSASMSGRVGWPSQRTDSEVSFVATFGSHRVDDMSVVLGSGDNPINATLVDNGSGRWAGFIELGAEAALYDNPIRILHAEQGLVTPTITIGAGYRRDARLARPAAIAEADWQGSDHRVYVRFMVDTVKQLQGRGLAASAKTFDLGFGLEYDRPLAKEKPMTPGVTRFVIRGNINLIRASSPTGEGRSGS